jgi:hypothetical protein
LGGLWISNRFDSLLRRTTNEALDGSTILARAIYGYDAAARVSTVSDGANSAAYSYLANSPLVGQVVFAHSRTTQMTATKTCDYLNRLTGIVNGNGTIPAVDSRNYGYNKANQRTNAAEVDGSYWVYGYDNLGQVTSGVKYWSDGTPVAGQQFDYTFDTIGNRLQTLSGGDSAGANLRTNTCANNLLNQANSRTAPGFVDPKSTRKNRKRNVRGLNEERKRCVGRTGHILKQRHENVKVVWRLKTVRAGCRAQKSYNPKTGLKDFGILRW